MYSVINKYMLAELIFLISFAFPFPEQKKLNTSYIGSSVLLPVLVEALLSDNVFYNSCGSKKCGIYTNLRP